MQTMTYILYVYKTKMFCESNSARNPLQLENIAMNDVILFSWQDLIVYWMVCFPTKNSWGPNEKVRGLIEKLGFTIWVNQCLSTSKITKHNKNPKTKNSSIYIITQKKHQANLSS